MALPSGERIDVAKLAWRCLGVMLATLLTDVSAPAALGQSRVAIPSTIEGGSSTSFAPNNNSGPTTFSPPVTSTPGYQSSQPTYQAPYVGGPYTPAQYNAAPSSGYGLPPSGYPAGAPITGAPLGAPGANTYTTPAYPTPAYNPGAAAYAQPGVGGATFQGSVTPAPTWDPYSSADGSPLGSAPYSPAPYNQSQSPGVLFPNGISAPFGMETYPGQAPACGQQPYQRLFREIRIEDTFLSGEGQNELNWNMAEVSATAVFPFFYQQAPLLVTPGFAFNNISTPGDVPDAGLPPVMYDAYLDTAWKPQITPFLSADLGFRIGVYSDFDHVDTDSVRLMGRGLLVMAFTPTVQLAGGVVYFDRLKTKLLPAGGVIWVPNEDTRFEILFPRPKLSKRLTTLGTTQVWGYIGGEYGGGSWSVHVNNGMGVDEGDRIDLNDIRITSGLEWRCHTGMRVWFEGGYVVSREVIYETNDQLNFDPENTFLFRGGLAY